MKESKPVKPGWAVQSAGQPQSTPESPSSAEAAMQTDAPPRKTGGRLSREDQRRLGDILQRMYDDVLREGVPDRFRNLLTELEEGGTESIAPAPRAEGEGGSDSDRVIGAQGLDNPNIKGPH